MASMTHSSMRKTITRVLMILTNILGRRNNMKKLVDVLTSENALIAYAGIVELIWLVIFIESI